MNWIDYWSDHKIEDTFWEKNIELYCSNLTRLTPLSKEYSILDYGSGPGYTAKYLSSKVNAFYLIEPSEILLEKSKRNNKANPNIVYHLLKDAEDLKNVYGKDRFDVILVNSVMQYIPPARIQILLNIFNYILKRNGKVVISDMVSKHSLVIQDVLPFVQFCLKTGTLMALLKFSMTEIKKLTMRSRLKYWTYSKEELEKLLLKTL